MANDQGLIKALGDAAAASKGRLTVDSRRLRDVGAALGIELGTSPNPIYEFTVSTPEQGTFQCVAYTNVVNGSGRPATRVEALATGLVADKGKLFESNPFLIVYDYVGSQFMAVSAAALFGAFAQEDPSGARQKAESATFSLTPNFKNRTITMYAEAPSGSIWFAQVDASLTSDSIIQGLIRIRDETIAAASKIPTIVSAIAARIAPPATKEASPVAVAAIPIPVLSEPSLQIDERVRRMVKTAIQSAKAVILVGPPGTGKTALLREVFRELTTDPAAFGLASFPEPLWATPDESWTTRELVGGETVVGGEIQFRPGWVLKAVADDRWLVLDEVNRADMDRIFGGLLTWLSGGTVSLGAASTATYAPQIELTWNYGVKESATEGIDADGRLVGAANKVRYSAGEGWRLLGTYNAIDAQRVFRFGAALGRRFVRVPIPAPAPSLFALALAEHATGLTVAMQAGIQGLYTAHFAAEATTLGPAIFLAMCNYLRVSSANESEQAGTGESSLAAMALAEAYVIHAGTWLAHLDHRDLDALAARIVADSVMGADEWAWVRNMTQLLA